jgi:hypothetical protein
MVTFAGAAVVGAACGVALGEEHPARKMANIETVARAGVMVKRFRRSMSAIVPHSFCVASFFRAFTVGKIKG